RAHDSLAAAGVADRCELVAGNFFESVTPGADAYVLKTVLHDWDDEQCKLILSNCAKAMPPDARLLIVERLMPEHFEDSPHDRGIARGDLNMLIAQDGKERTLEQYKALLDAAGLHLKRSLKLSIGFDVLIALRS
ncbi:MAG: methyltransferase, partial [Chitinophagaceae bacterium]|nr:methyltransferase [Rubrivivax sp.]